MSNKPRWIQNADGSIFHIDSRRTLCGVVARDGARCTLLPGHTRLGHLFQLQYPPEPGSKVDQFLATSLDPVIDPQPGTAGYPLPASLIDLDARPNHVFDAPIHPSAYTGPKPSSLYPHDMDMPKNHAWRTHPDQVKYGSSRRMSVHTSANIQRSELHYLIDQLFDHAEDTGKPIDLGTLKLEVLTDETLGHHVTRISAVTQAPTTD